MEKEKITIRKIRDNSLVKKMDEVAVEQQVCIPLKSGQEVWVTCTPSFLEEMTAARRYLAGEWESDWLAKSEAAVKNDTDNDSEDKFLREIALDEIFQIAHNSFENPGPLFVDTGCAHSCALIYKGKVMCCIEDIGRHNALDKVIGYALLHKIPFSESYVFTSGRVSGDYLQKVIDVGFPMVVSRAAVTGNAVTLAKEKNITLLGFIRKNTGNLYWEGAVKIGCDVK